MAVSPHKIMKASVTISSPHPTKGNADRSYKHRVMSRGARIAPLVVVRQFPAAAGCPLRTVHTVRAAAICRLS
jgi:hypothetical protein